MKKIKLIITAIFFGLLSFSLQAQPPDPPGGHGETEDQESGGGAPLGSGIIIMTVLGAAYAGKKAYNIKKDFEL